MQDDDMVITQAGKVHAKKPFTDRFLTRRSIYVLYFIGINVMNIQSVIINRMNVWKIFRYAWFHLVSHQDLYRLYPKEYFDSFLYSPSFPVLFAPFSLLPYYVAYFLWNNISMLLFAFLVFRLKGFTEKQKALICLISLLDLLTCLQGTQTNVMIGCLLLLTYLSFENGKYIIAALAIAAGFYLKIYPLAGAVLFLFYPQKIKFLLSLAVAMIIGGLLPLMFISFHELVLQYKSWMTELVFDRGDNVGKISLTGLVQVYLHVSEKGKSAVQLAGLIFLMLPFLRRNFFELYYYRVHYFALLMIWVVVFNHASEIYGYAIAICGVGIWFVLQKAGRRRTIWIIAFIFFGTFLSIDPTPKVVTDYVFHHALKTVPFTIIMLILMYQMLFKSMAFFREKAALISRSPEE